MVSVCLCPYYYLCICVRNSWPPSHVPYSTTPYHTHVPSAALLLLLLPVNTAVTTFQPTGRIDAPGC